MKKPLELIILALIITLSACRSEEPVATIAAPVATALRPGASPSAALETIEPPTPDITPAVSPSAEITPVQPQPNLLPYDWDDPRVFHSGLVSDEIGITDELNGASVYHILLQIDDPTAVSGQMEVRYTNQEEVELDKIYFHRFANQLGGSMTVSDVTVDGMSVDPELGSTAVSVPLSTPLKPDESVIIAMDFWTSVPQGESTKYNILAYDEDILALAHFYPMIAAFDESRWHIEPSPPHGDETFADMSYYIVQVTAPNEQIIVTSGVEVERREDEENQTLTLAAGPMRDFYLVMSDRFGVVSRDVGEVQINSFAPHEFLDGAELALDVTAAAVNSYSKRYGPYPYRELDVVSTPTLALGVEYPGVFANALRIYDIHEDPKSSATPNRILLEATTAHETAHQWFYNLVGNDQLNEPWLDEALTQYATWTYYIDRYGEQNARGYYASLEGRWSRSDFAEIPVGLPAKAYSSTDYGAIVYGRGPVFLNELAKEMGQDNFDLFMRDYVAKYSWKIASARDFQDLAEEHCNCDLSTIFNNWVYG